jgi:hypothetical protein
LANARGFTAGIQIAMKFSRNVLFRICTVLAGPPLILVISVLISRQQLIDYKEELTSKGDTFDLRHQNVSLPPEVVSRTREFGEAGGEIAAALKSSQLRNFSPPYPKDPARRIVFHRLDLPMVSGSTPYPWTDVEADCLAIEPALSRVREITKQGPIEAHPDYTRGFSAILPLVAEAQAAGFALIGQSYLYLHNGQPGKAAQNIEAALRIAAMLYRQKTIVGQAIGMGMLNASSQATWDLLQAENLTEDSLLDLQREWESVSIVDTFPDVLRTERNTGLSVFELPPVKALGPIAAIGTPTDPFSLESLKTQSYLLLWRTLFQYSDERQFLQTFQAIRENIPPDPKNGSWEQALQAAETHLDRAENAGVTRLISKLILPTETFVLYPVSAQTQAHLTATAIAIRRYQLANGKLPDSLTDLKKEFSGGTAPLDLFNGHPLHYRKLNEGEYLLYSIGSNLADDGGTASDRRVLKSKDIVWPQPLMESPEAAGTK